MPNGRTYIWNSLVGLQGLLKNLYNSGIPGDIKNRLSQGFDYRLNQQFNDYAQNIQSHYANSGLSNSGLITAALSDLFGKKAGAEEQFQANLANLDWGARQNSLAQLLGLNEYLGGLVERRLAGDRQNEQFNQSLQEKMREFNLQMDAYNKANSWYNTLLPALLGAGSKVLTGGMQFANWFH